MHKKKEIKSLNKKMDGFDSVLTNILVGIEEIKINNQKELPDFLLPENIALVKKCINDYQQSSTFILEKDKALFESGRKIQSKAKEDWTTQEIKKMLDIVRIITTREKRMQLIGFLNDTAKTPFVQLLNNDNELQIESIHSQWVQRSHFAQIPSVHLPLIAQMLKNIKTYFGMVENDKVLPNIIKKYQIHSDLIERVKNARSLIKFEEENLCRGMLARLTLAKRRLADDVLLATYDSLIPLGFSEVFFNKYKKYFTRELLSNELLAEFYNYIVSVNNNSLLNELEKIYSLIPAESTSSMPSYVMINMPGFCYKNKPWPSEPSDFSAAKLKGSTFLCSNFRNSLLVSADLDASDLRDAYLENANAQFANFMNADGRGAHLQWMYAKSAIFKSADFSYASFHGAYLYNANFKKCRLDETDFQLANLQQANFFGTTGSCNFNGADLSNANMLKIDIAKNSYIGASLIGTQFIKDESNDEIVFLLDTLEKQLKNRTYEKELILALEQNIIAKIESESNEEEIDIRKSPLLRHTLFTESRAKSSPLSYPDTSFYQFFTIPKKLINDLSMVLHDGEKSMLLLKNLTSM